MSAALTYSFTEAIRVEHNMKRGVTTLMGLHPIACEWERNRYVGRLEKDVKTSSFWDRWQNPIIDCDFLHVKNLKRASLVRCVQSSFLKQSVDIATRSRTMLHLALGNELDVLVEVYFGIPDHKSIRFKIAANKDPSRYWGRWWADVVGYIYIGHCGVD